VTIIWPSQKTLDFTEGSHFRVNCFTRAESKIAHFIKRSQSAGNIALQKCCHPSLENR